MFLEQLKRERFVALRERAVADHVREHNRGELAMLGEGLGHIAPRRIQGRSLPERSLEGKGFAPPTKLYPVMASKLSR